MSCGMPQNLTLCFPLKSKHFGISEKNFGSYLNRYTMITVYHKNLLGNSQPYVAQWVITKALKNAVSSRGDVQPP